MNNPHDWSEAYESICQHLQNEDIDPTPHLFCLEHDHNDGCLLLLGKNQQPMYVVVVSLGRLETAALGQFVDRIAGDFVRTYCEGRRDANEPWCLFGPLPAAQSLPTAERNQLEESIAPLTREVKERFEQMQMNN